MNLYEYAIEINQAGPTKNNVGKVSTKWVGQSKQTSIKKDGKLYLEINFGKKVK